MFSQASVIPSMRDDVTSHPGVCGLSHGDVVCPGGMCSVPWLMPGGLPQGEGCGPFHHQSPGGPSRGWSVTGGSVLWSVLGWGVR